MTVVTPIAGTPASATQAIINMWRAVGSKICTLSPAEHDTAVAEASHLPHVLASAAAAALGDGGLPLAASGFRDTTRVAAGSVDLWTQILLENRDAVAALIADTARSLDQLATALRTGERAVVSTWLERARSGRRRFDEQRQTGLRDHEG